MDRDETVSAAGSAVRYSWVAIVLHWAIAALIIFEVALGLRMGALKGLSQFAVFQLHKSVGITILALVLYRVIWRFVRLPPAVDATGWERVLAHGVHAAFYVMLLLLPLSGWMIVSTSALAVPTLLYGVVPWPHLPVPFGSKVGWHDAAEWLHSGLVTLGYGLVGLHVAGALKHHLVDRSFILARMAPGTKPGAWTDPRLLGICVLGFGAAGLGLMWPASPPVTKQVEVGEIPASTSSEAVSAPVVEASAAPSSIPSTEAAVDDASVSEWAIAAGSSLKFSTSWSGEAISGGFTRFSGDIAFSPEKLAESRVVVTVDSTSVFSGDSQRDETLKSAEWFATGSHASAVFRATQFRKVGADRYVANGTLRIKGATAPLSLPFTLKINGDRARMQGNAVINRLTYRIGEGEFSSTAEIPATVNVSIVINAVRK